MKSASKNLVAILFLLGIIILFFSPFFFSGNIPYAGDFSGSDLTELNLPLRYLAKEAWQHWQFPLWSNLLANGFSVLAEGQAGVFYPFNLIFYNFLPFFWAVNLGFLINFFLASLFIYFYCRLLKISHFGSLLAALAFSLSGFFIFRLKHLNLINAAIWLPLQFYLVEKFFISKRRPLIIILLSLVFAIQFFAGHPQISYLALVCVFIYFLLKSYFTQSLKLEKILSVLVKPWLMIGLITFGLVAIQFLPTLFNVILAGRGSTMTYSDIIRFPYLPLNLLNFVLPYYFGNPANGSYNIANLVFWENNIYFGILPLLLALVAIFFLYPKNQSVKILTLLFFSSWLLIFGNLSPVFVIFWKVIPGFNMFRFPQRFLLLTLFCLVVLAGFGFDFIIDKLNSWQQKSKKFLNQKLLFNYLLPLCLVLVVAVDLFLISYRYVGALNFNSYFSPPKSAEFLKSDQDNFRIYSIDWPITWSQIKFLSGGWQNNMELFIAGRELLPPNLNVFSNIASAQDRASLEGGMLVQENHYLANRLMTETWINNSEKQLNISDQHLRIFGLENIKYFLSYRHLVNSNLKEVKKITSSLLPPLIIYQNPYFLPFAFGVFDVKLTNSESEMINQLFSQDFKPESQILLLKGQAGTLTESNQPGGQADIKNIQLKDQKVVIEVNYSKTGYLFLSQSLVPGWKAKIDGRPTKILRADYAFMSVLVPAGSHQVVFYYQPLAFILGLWISIFTCLAIIIFLIIWFKNRHGKTIN